MVRQYRSGATESSGGCYLNSYIMKDGISVAQLSQVKKLGCVADFSTDKQWKYVDSLEEANTSFGSSNGGEEYVFVKANSAKSFPFSTASSYYGSACFATEIRASNASGAFSRMLQLQEAKWIDLNTRAVAFDFNVYNSIVERPDDEKVSSNNLA